MFSLKKWWQDRRQRESLFDNYASMPKDPEIQMAMANVVLHDLIQERRSNRQWVLLKRVAIAAFFALSSVYYIAWQANSAGWRVIPQEPLVGVVRIEGSIMNTSLASAEKIIPALRAAAENDNVKAIILAVDSPGGAPVEAERINTVLDEIRAKNKKPIYAVIQNVGASAAYMISLHADKIYAARYSMVGSIGAVMSAWDVNKALAKYDVYQHVYASGELKAMLNPFVPSTEAAQQKAQDLVNIMGHKFVTEVKARRGKLLKADTKYDTGEIWDGEQAHKIGLIDGINTIEGVAAQYKDAKIYEFGPSKTRSGIFSSSVSDWVQSLLSSSIRDAMTVQQTPTIQ